MLTGATGCDTMTNGQKSGAGAMLDDGGTMVAAFWKAGKVTKIHRVDDCEINAQPDLTEIVLHTSLGEHLLFIVSNDPTVEADMTSNGNVCAFDGFQLTGPEGNVIERMTVFDNKQVH